jgi:Flp pilus assembly protein TadG
MSPFSSSSAMSFLRRLMSDRRGSIAIVAGIIMPVLLGLGGLAFDMGNVLAAQNRLKAVTNAAALVGAQALVLPNATAATATAAAQSWATAHPVPNLTVTGVTATAKCAKPISTMPNCTATNPNIITVTQTVAVPAFFAKIVGFAGPFTVSAVSSASKAGGTAVPLNIIIVLDATQSMNAVDTGCTVPGVSYPTREQCALYGVQEILGVMVPPQDQIALMAFPGYGSALTTPCTNTKPGVVAPYFTPGISYTVASLNTNYNNGSGVLNTGSNLVKAAGSAPSTAPCFKAQGGEGSFLAEAISAAQAAFPQTAGTQNVMILLSDGDATTNYTQMYCVISATVKTCPSNSAPAWVAHGAAQCDQSVTAAAAAKAAGTWIYSVAYDAPTTACASGGTYTPCTEMRNIASDPTRFFTTSATCVAGGGASPNLVTSLPAALLQIAYSLNKARLIPAT